MESSDDSRVSTFYNLTPRQIDRVAAGKRLRVEGQKRTEVEYKQMLRLCEMENKELKDSLRYVEIKLAKTKDNLRQMTTNYENAQEEIQKCHEQIARSANINHAQAQQIEEMNKKLDTVAQSHKEIIDKSKLRIQQYQNQVDIGEMEINRIKKLLQNSDNEVLHQQTQIGLLEKRIEEQNAELEMKSAENNRLRQQVADMEVALQDLYKSRKGNGTLQIEMDSLKSDNERLIELLKGTTDYADMSDDQITQVAKGRMSSAALSDTFSATRRTRGVSADSRTKRQHLNNDWIPTESVRAITKIKEEFNEKMTEQCVSQILYKLNLIWRNIMRKENDAIKKRMSAQIQDLRRQIVTKQAFDKGELMTEITRTKKELAFANKQLHNKKKNGQSLNNKENEQPDEIEKNIRLVESIGFQKKILEDENAELKSRIEEYERLSNNPHTRVDQQAALNASEMLQQQLRLNLPSSQGDMHGQNFM